MTGIEHEKRLAAEAAAELVEDGMRVGLGTGSTVAHSCSQRSRARDARHPLRRNVACRRRSRRARSVFPSSRSTRLDRLDLAIDGADQIAPDGWLVKGGGAAHTREKIVAAAADRFVVIASSDKPVDRIAPPVPARADVVRPAGDVARRSARSSFETSRTARTAA